MVLGDATDDLHKMPKTVHTVKLDAQIKDCDRERKVVIPNCVVRNAPKDADVRMAMQNRNMSRFS